MKRKTSPLVSIVILTKDQRTFLDNSLAAIYSQTITNIEVIIVETEGKENIDDFFTKYPLNRIIIKPKNFTYASAFNQGARIAKGKYIVRLSGDAVPKNKYWLEKLLKNFDNPQVGGVYSRWINNAHANFFDKYIVFLTMPNKKLTFTRSPNWSGAAGALRKSLWQKYPFDERLKYCEDLAWSRTIQKKGYTIVYEPASEVYHSNNENVFKFFMRGIKSIKAMIQIYFHFVIK